ncbi:uncharacterized protein SAPINGB_P005578 [Magnusiomyces paraingens]|uniref:Protein GLC8 n=1 Tax=Magnusiomyces paraingens TaxID=2606893 RepID=A0A5E8C5P5_9ASCO|nr:uncharacterized protein SAPINGB_P005578 [Saprochaete ingens]VVT57188.1 unnamed protein product [Saprochaete ingens]
MTDQTKPRGILRNRTEHPNILPGAETPDNAVIESGDAPKFDRHAVLLNTKANAQIHAVGNAIIKKHQNELAEELTKKGKPVPASLNATTAPTDATAGSAIAGSTENGEDGHLPEHLKWDEVNLYLTEQEKNATMKITEPKTPYQSHAGSTEYYKEDDDDLLDGEEGLILGEPELPVQSDATIENDRIVKDESVVNEPEEEEEEETPEEKHKRFEELRKKHYFMKGAVLHHPNAADEEDKDDDDN